MSLRLCCIFEVSALHLQQSLEKYLLIKKIKINGEVLCPTKSRWFEFFRC